MSILLVPSDLELSGLPNCSRVYIAGLEEMNAELHRQLDDAKAEIKTLRNYAVNVTERRTVKDEQVERVALAAWDCFISNTQGAALLKAIRAALEAGDD